MSLNVSPELLYKAESGEVSDAEFVECVQKSLPFAWSVVSRIVDELNADCQDFADNVQPPPDEVARGQLLRALASDSIRGGLERHFGVKLAFQNCHRVAAFRLSAVDSEKYHRFISPVSQLRNQSPELRNC